MEEQNRHRSNKQMRDGEATPAPENKSKGLRPIHYYKKNVYGVEKNYMHDADVAEHVHKLTGQTTLSDRHIEALQALGHEVKHEPKY
ncbi:MAG: hypothetical protein KGI71_06085 [Patescibacteria group bacterium]|nr:hypothetical protein [Patescibacteria group bacterium]